MKVKDVKLPQPDVGCKWYFIRSFQVNGRIHPAFIINGEETDGIWMQLTDEEAKEMKLTEEVAVKAES